MRPSKPRLNHCAVESLTEPCFFDSRCTITDSDGGLLFENGWTCHVCLGEPFSSDEATVQWWLANNPRSGMAAP